MNILVFNEIFSENASILSAQTNIDIISDFEAIENHTYIIYGAHEVALNLYMIQKEHKVKYIILNSESEQSDFLRNKFYITLLKNNYVFNYSKYNSNYLLNALKISTYGFYNFEFKIINKEKEREFKIGFIGKENKRRLNILSDLSKTNKCYIDFNNKNMNPNNMKHTLLNCEWLVNIPYYTHKNFEQHRVNNALSCGCKVVSLCESMDEETRKLYEPYIYITDDLTKFFNKIPDEPKLKYIDLINNEKWIDTNNFNNWMFKKIKSNI